ncbi:MAG: hypothetical protein OHK0017_13780 [Patescibacteria group bacterium]
MILVTKKTSAHSDDGAKTQSSTKIVSTFLKRSKKSNIVNRIKKIKYFQKEMGTLQKKRKALGRKKYEEKKELYMKTHRFSKYGF